MTRFIALRAVISDFLKMRVHRLPRFDEVYSGRLVNAVAFSFHVLATTALFSGII